MHLLSLVPAFMAAGALAAPRPQMPDYAAVDALLPELTKTIDVTAKPTIIDFDVTGAIEDVAAAVETGIVAISKRAARTPDNSGCGVCKNEPTIANSYNVDVSTDTAFLGDTNIIAAANGATTPTGYTSVFTNKKASLNGYVYMGYTVLKSTPAYDPSVCATKCDAMVGCQSFNIFFERNPTQDACSTTCENPVAFANIKCSFWGGPATLGMAKNDGQWRRLFHVVIAGSNAYNKNGVPESPGYSPIQSLGEAAINAERDCNGVDTYMTYKLFTNTPFDPRLCAAACDAETAYAVAHPPATGPVRKCNFWNTYLLARNGEAQGQYCSLYTEPHGAQFATNRGQWRGNDQYTILASYSSYNLTSPGYPVCPADITYLNAQGPEFCTSYLGYVAPHTTTAVVGTTSATLTVDTTRTDVQTVTVTAQAQTDTLLRRDEATPTEDSIVVETVKVVWPAKNTDNPHATAPITSTISADAAIAKRAVATPASVVGWDAARLSAACSGVATGTITDTTTTSVSTVYVATDTNTASTQTVTTLTVPGVVLAQPTPVIGSLSGAPRDIDDEYYELNLPFAIGAFGTYSTKVFLTTNGMVTLPTGTTIWDNDYYGFPSASLPNVVIAGLFDDLYIYQGSQQGIYYEIFGETGHRSIVFEIYMSAYQRRTEFYHFSMTFYEDQPGVALFKYYEVSRSGNSAHVGAQKWSERKSLIYSALQPKIHSGLSVKLDTVAGTITEGSF